MTYLFSNTVSIFQSNGSAITTINPLPVTLGSANINIIGNISVPTTVNVASSADNPVHSHITEVGTSGILNNPWMPVAGNVSIDGNVAGITRLPSITGNVHVWGNVSIDQLPGISVTGITGNINANINGNIAGNLSGITTLPAISGNVEITRMPGVTGNVHIWGNIGGIDVVPAITVSSIAGNITGNITGNIGGITTLPSVTGNVHVYGNVNVDNFPSNVSITSMPGVSIVGNVKLDTTVAPAVYFADTIQMDPTERLRVVTGGQQWWYVPTVDKDGDLRLQEKFVGTGAQSVFVQNLASVELTPGTTYNANTSLTGTAIRASRRRFKTYPGVSTEWVGVVNWDGLDTNVTKRMGMFTNYNGAFFEVTDDLYVVIRKRMTDGTLVETRVKRSDFNVDKLNGLGPSGINWDTDTLTETISGVNAQSNVAIAGDGTVYRVQYNISGNIANVKVGDKYTITGVTPTGFNGCALVTAVDSGNNRANVVYNEYPGAYSSVSSARMTKTAFHDTNVFLFDYRGSRTGRIRFSLQYDKHKYVLHDYLDPITGTQFFNAPALMDRKEIVNTGVPAYTPRMTIGGSAVNVETSAGINPGFGSAFATTPINFNKNTPGIEYAIVGVGIRPGEPYQRADIQVNQFQIVDTGNLNPQNAGIFQWRLILNPTLSAAGTYTDVGKATHQITYPAATTATGGITLLSGYSQGTFTGDTKTALNFLNMGSNIDYTATDEVVLMVKLLVGGSSDSNIVGAINYTEDI